MTYQLTADDYELLRVLFYPENEPPCNEAKVAYDSETLPLCYKLVKEAVITMTVAAHQDFVVIGKIQNKAQNPATGSQWGTDDHLNMYEEFVLNTGRSTDPEWWDESEDDEFPYPKLYRNKGNDCIVLAINPTCGTIVREATNSEPDAFVLPVGTFQTCFIPFHIDDEWEIINKVEIEL